MDIEIVKKILRDLVRVDSAEFPQCDVLTFATDNSRALEFKTKRYAPIVDTVEDELRKRGLVCGSVSRIASRIKGDKSYGRVLTSEGRFARALVGKRFKQLWSRDYPFSNAEAAIWRDIFLATGARAMLGINPSRELCSAAHALNIWVADIQHGVISSGHNWYGAAARQHDPTDWLPHTFFVWDTDSAQALDWARARGIAIEVEGNPWLGRFQFPAADDSLLAHFASAFPAAPPDRPSIVVSLTWGSKPEDNFFIAKPLEKYILDTIDRFDWRFRLHPNQVHGYQTDEGRALARYFADTYPPGSIEWEDATAMPLPLLLSRASLHVTWGSSVCMEAAYLGVPSLLTDPNLLPGKSMEGFFEGLADAGYATKIKPKYSDIARWIEANLEQKLPFYQDHSNSAARIADRVAYHAG